jgi:serine/threonine-protein kinase RsbW
LSETAFPRTQTFLGSYDSLADISAFVRQAAQDVGLGDFAMYMVETAVDEACSNIIEHAYGAEGLGKIEITCQDTPNALNILIQDWGRAFDPEAIPDPEMHADLEDLPGHGLGLFFIRKWMDEVRFTFSGDGNILTLVKHKE